RMFYIWITNINISSFDCFVDEDGLSHWRADPDIICFKDNYLQIVGAVIAIINLIVFFSLSIILNIAIYNHNPKNGGLLSCPNGTFASFQNIMLFGNIFIVRMLYGWPFWRGVVNVGVSILICVYAFEGLMNNITPTIIFIFVGAILAVGMIFLNWYLVRFQQKKLFLLKKGKPCIDIRSEDFKNQSFPKQKDPTLVEPSTRFLQNKRMRKYDWLVYADYIYTHALKRHKHDPYLYFMYANFLTYYRKNAVKAQTVYRQARINNPSIFLRFVLYCKTKESGRGSGEGQGEGGSGSELSNLAFKALIQKAYEHHENAKNALKAFFENMSSPNPIYSVMADHLDSIVEEEAKGRKSYEELLVTHPQNVGVIRSYAQLLLDIYHDEDTAEMLLSRADRIEEFSTQSSSGNSTDEGEENTVERDMNASDVANQQNKKVKEGTINESIVLGTIDSNEAFEVHDDLQQLNQQQNEQQFDKLNVVHSFHKKKSVNVHQQKKKRKKKKQQDSVMTEITTGTSTNSSLGLIIGGLLFTAHILAIIIYVISMAIYISEANQFAQQVSNLKSVCDLATYCCQMSPLGLMMLVHDYEYNFQYPGSTDGKASTIRPLPALQSKLRDISTDIVKVISQIYDMTSLTDPWEENSMETYIFETGNAQCERVDNTFGECEGMILRHQEATNNLIGGFIEMAQKAHYMGDAEGDLHQFSTFHSDLAYMMFNAISPILEDCKRAMVEYWMYTTDLTNRILIIFLVVILSFMILEFTLLAIIYIMFSLKIIKERRNAFQQALEVSKQKMQKVIRRLLQDEEVDDNDDHSDEGTLNTQNLASDEFGTIHKEKPTTAVDVSKEFDDIGKIGKDKQIQDNSNEQNQFEEQDDDEFEQKAGKQSEQEIEQSDGNGKVLIDDAVH
ncbi:MAG: hypothetical protein EZS28_022567, partial [Streblomastix strix]